MKKRILIVFGTRPEAIKMSPLVKEFQKFPDIFETKVCVSGQHRQMLDQVLELFEIRPDFDLKIMKEGQDLFDITSRVLTEMRDVLLQVKPDLVLVHGDTTTSMAAALAAYYSRTEVGHVEAGLRTNNIYSPWPEEINRQVTGRIAHYHFAPTELSKQNLIDENVASENIVITGNTVIDALRWVLAKIETDIELKSEISEQILKFGYNISQFDNQKKIVLITGHRRENFGEGFVNICRALNSLAEKHPDVDFIYPMHLNPNVRKPIMDMFGDQKNKNIYFIEPLDYLPFIFLMQKSYMILTDSGGIQEEAPGLRKPVLVMRDTTERPEAVTAGTVKLVGTDYNKITEEVSRLLSDSTYYEIMSKANNPYGDGRSSVKIVNFLKENFRL